MLTEKKITDTIRMKGKESNETVSLTFDSYSALFRSILVDTGDAVLFTREDVKIEDVNDRACDIHLGTREEFLGRDCRRLIDPSHRLFFARGNLQTAGAGDRYSYGS